MIEFHTAPLKDYRFGQGRYCGYILYISELLVLNEMIDISMFPCIHPVNLFSVNLYHALNVIRTQVILYSH